MKNNHSTCYDSTVKAAATVASLFSKPTNFMGDGWVRERLERLYMDGASAVAEAVTTMDECTKDSILTIIQKL